MGDQDLKLVRNALKPKLERGQTTTSTSPAALFTQQLLTRTPGVGDDPHRVPGRMHSGDGEVINNGNCFCPCQWFQCTCAAGCTCTPLSEKEKYPYSIQCKCMELVLLSRPHYLLILGVFFSISLMGMAVVFIWKLPGDDGDPEDSVYTGILTSFLWVRIIRLLATTLYAVSLVSLLVRFEKIDIIQKLENEIKDLEAEKLRLTSRQEQMVEFWNRMQQLTHIWVHRTTPRLELLNTLQTCLEDIMVKDATGGGGVLGLEKALESVNKHLEKLEHSLPRIEMWAQDSLISEAGKKAFTQKIKSIYNVPHLDLPQILLGLEKVLEVGSLTSTGNDHGRYDQRADSNLDD